MFDSAELGHSIDDATYAKTVQKLRGDLLDTQYDLLQNSKFPVIVLVNGVDGAGKGETVNLLNEWMDPRHIANHAFGPPSDEEATRPKMWRYWRALPAKGKIGILFGNWYTAPIIGRVHKTIGDAELIAEIEAIRRFEQMLHDDGALVVKLWFHLGKKAQKQRLEALEANKLTRWRVTKNDWKAFRKFDAYREVSERVLRETSTGDAPWLVIDGSDANYRAVTAGKALLTTLRGRLAEATPKVVATTSGTRKVQALGAPDGLMSSVDTARILRDLPFKERLSKAKYEVKIERLQARLARLSRKPEVKKHAVVLVFEGMDAAGKGGAVRRVTQALDARVYSVIPVAAPTEEERAHPYLWRFWRHLPPQGRFVIFDRSWYGRVLVERVEGFATAAAWTRAYGEINDFEDQLAKSGVIVAKFWLAITKEEQLRRFKEREKTRFKRFKITPEDWRNRKKWEAYEMAASDMIERTSTSSAPWTIIEANDKHLARAKVVETVCDRIERAL